MLQPGSPHGPTPGERAAGPIAEALVALADVESAARGVLEDAHAGLADLCRLRIATLLTNDVEVGRSGRTTDATLAALAAWPTSERFSAAERAALAYAEQVVIDPARVDGDLVAAMSPGMSTTEIYVLARFLQATEARQRVELLFRHDERLAALMSSCAALAVSR